MTALTPQQKERLRGANARASKIRTGITTYLETLAAISTAYEQRDWETLGYDSWQEYIDNEYSAERLRIAFAYRQKAIEDLRLAGLSTRAIAPVVGVHHSTVARQVSQDATPEPVQGVDGKTYSPARSSLVAAITGAIEDAEKRNETAGAGQGGPAPAPDGAASAAAPEEPPATTPGSSSTAPEAAPPAASGAPDLPGVSRETGEAGRSSHEKVLASPTEHPVDANASGVPGQPEPVNPPAGAGEQGGPVTSPAGRPCEKCGGEIEAEQAKAGYTRCDTCDVDGDHVDDGNGCRGCRVLAESDPAYVLSIGEGPHGLFLECGECDGVVAHLSVGGSLPEILAAARDHYPCIA